MPLFAPLSDGATLIALNFDAILISCDGNFYTSCYTDNVFKIFSSCLENYIKMQRFFLHGYFIPMQF